MAQTVMTLGAANALLKDLAATIVAVANLPDSEAIRTLDSVERQLEALRALMKQARLSLAAQNQVACARFDAHFAIGALLDKRLPHGGGRPETVVADDSFPTLAELGFSRDFSAYTQTVFRGGWDALQEWLKLGSDDDTGDAAVDKPAYERPIELTRRGLLDFLDWRDSKRRGDATKATCTAQAHRDAERAHGAATRTASTAAARATASSGQAAPADDKGDTVIDDTDAEIEPDIKIDPELLIWTGPREIKLPTRADKTVLAALRTAIEQYGKNDHEALAALGAAYRIDPRLETLGKHNDATYDTLMKLRDEVNRQYDRAEALQDKLREFADNPQSARLQRMQVRDRQRLGLIRDQKLEIDRLTAVIEQIHKDHPATRPKGMTQHESKIAATTDAAHSKSTLLPKAGKPPHLQGRSD